MLLSIIVPSRNQGRFIAATLDSILAQDHRPLEVIVVDGGSTDGTLDLLARYAERHPELRWISEPDQGPADAVNKGLALARGEIAAIQSSDDLYCPGAFRAVAEAFSRRPDVGFVIGHYQGMDADGKVHYTCELPEFSWEAYFGLALCIPQSSIFFRMGVAREAGGWNGAYFSCDLDYWLRLLLRTRALRLDRILSLWRLHAGGRTHSGRQAEIWDGYQRMIRDNRELRAAPLRVRRLARASRHIFALRFHPTGSRRALQWHLLCAFALHPTFWRYQDRGQILGLLPRLLRPLARIGRRLLAPGDRAATPLVQQVPTEPPLWGKVHFHGAGSREEAAIALSQHGERFWRARGNTGWVAVTGTDEPMRHALEARLRRLAVPFRTLGTDELDALPGADAAEVAGVLCASTRTAEITETGRRLVRHPLLAQTPIEYAAGLDPAQETFRRLDEYRDSWFISPLVAESAPAYEIYAESLGHFEQKCGLRDFLDLYQLLLHVHRNGVAGDVAEFGSFRGHSGWLIARTLQHLGSPKAVYLFDTFEQFPNEPLGVDGSWSGTHPVDFADVRARFQGLDNVRFVKGDFTQTLPASGLGQVALAYVDCDSYRATRFLIDAVHGPLLARNGVMAFEDYGHLALLGNRLAVHDGLRDRGGGFQFFSQFSGLYVTVKT